MSIQNAIDNGLLKLAVANELGQENTERKLAKQKEAKYRSLAGTALDYAQQTYGTRLTANKEKMDAANAIVNQYAQLAAEQAFNTRSRQALAERKGIPETEKGNFKSVAEYNAHIEKLGQERKKLNYQNTIKELDKLMEKPIITDIHKGGK